MINPLTKEQFAQLKNLSDQQLQEIEFAGREWYNSAAEIRKRNILNGIRNIKEYKYRKISTAKVLQNPYGVRIFTSHFPPKMSQYPKTKFVKKINYSEIRAQWNLIIADGIKDIEMQGYAPPNQAIIIYNFHFPRLANPDNMNVMLCTEELKELMLVADDNPIIYLTGILDPTNPGTEIFILSVDEFIKHPDFLQY